MAAGHATASWQVHLSKDNRELSRREKWKEAPLPTSTAGCPQLTRPKRKKTI